jgi:hypothetical protein
VNSIDGLAFINLELQKSQKIAEAFQQKERA